MLNTQIHLIGKQNTRAAWHLLETILTPLPSLEDLSFLYLRDRAPLIDQQQVMIPFTRRGGEISLRLTCRYQMDWNALEPASLDLDCTNSSAVLQEQILATLTANKIQFQIAGTAALTDTRTWVQLRNLPLGSRALLFDGTLIQMRHDISEEDLITVYVLDSPDLAAHQEITLYERALVSPYTPDHAF